MKEICSFLVVVSEIAAKRCSGFGYNKILLFSGTMDFQLGFSFLFSFQLID